MNIIKNIKKYRKSVGFSLIILGGVGSILGICLFIGGGMHGVGVPAEKQNNPNDVTWSRVSMGFLNFEGTGYLVNWLKNLNLINDADNSINFRNFRNLSNNKLIRTNMRLKINNQEKQLANITDKGAAGVLKQLTIRTNIDLMQSFLTVESMYDLSISGSIIMPIGIIIWSVGMYLWYSGIRKDKKETKAFMENLNNVAQKDNN